MHNTLTSPIITYANENCTLTKKDESSVNAMEMKRLRIAGKTKWDTIKSEDIRERTNIEKN